MLQQIVYPVLFPVILQKQIPKVYCTSVINITRQNLYNKANNAAINDI